LQTRLQLLLNLQRVDDSLREALQKQHDLPERIKEQETKLEEEKQRLEGLRLSLKQTTLEQRRLEKELNESVEQLKKKQSRLFEIKTNEEYRALLKEIEYTKQSHSDMEDRIILMFDDIEHIEKSAQEREHLCRLSEENLVRERHRVEKEMSAIQEEIQRLQEERSRICGQLDPEVLEQYETLKNRRSGLAVVVVQRDICPGCNLYIPPQTINEVLQTGEIRQCPHCRRILYCEME